MAYWLVILVMSQAWTPLVFLPEPFDTIEACEQAGQAFKSSKLDLWESGVFACIPVAKDTP